MTGEAGRPGPALVLGVGNRDRGDDAIGPIVAEVLANRWPATVEAAVVEGDLSTLALRWRPEHRVVVVDATVSGAEPGTAVVMEWPPAGPVGRAGLGSTPSSTHSIGLAAALELARLLGRLPAALTVVGVEGASFDLLAPLSPAVAAAVEPVVAQVASLLGLARPSPAEAPGLALGVPAGPGVSLRGVSSVTAMEIVGIDHVILPTPNPDGTAARWQGLGLRLTPPMRHAGSSTESSVFFVGGPHTEFYVELLAVHDRARAIDEGRQDLLDAIDRGGLYRLMLQVASAPEAAEALSGHGIEVATRTVQRDDGSLIGTVVEPIGATGAGCSFALIAYEGGAEARRARHAAAGLFQHALPLARLDHLAVIAPDGVDEVCAFWASVLGVPQTGRVRGRGMDIRQLRIGDATLELIGPDGADSSVRQRPAGLASVTAFEVADLDAVVAQIRSVGFELADPTPGVLPRSRVSTVSPDQLGGLALQLISFDQP